MSIKKGKYRLNVKGEFAASHNLRHFAGKCEALHGHNFAVEFAVEGDTLAPKTELLVDFGVLKMELKRAIAPLDHAYLNEVPPFDVQNPSSENLARYIYKALEPRMLELGVRIIWVTVAERAIQSATYFEE